MKIIDTHLHLSSIQLFKDTANAISLVDYSAKGLTKELREAGIIAAIGMGLGETLAGAFPDPLAPNPMILNDASKRVPHLYTCLGINPFPLMSPERDQTIAAIEAALVRPEVVGLKIYLGYYPFYAYDDAYEPLYRLAAEHHVPVVFHCGDTYSERGILKYAHPLTIDEVAVTHRQNTFVIAHFGDPWIMDAAEVVTKNANVFCDLSGLIVGDARDILRFQNQPIFRQHIQRGLIYADSYHKFIFGSDWPLVPLQAYIHFIKTIIPAEHHHSVFYQNALNVFTKMRLQHP